MATVDTILVKVEADLRDVKRSLAELERNTKNTTEKVNRSFSAIGTTLRSVFGVVAVAQFARAGNSAIQFASDVQEMRDKSSVVFGEFAGEVRKQLQDFGEEVGRSRFELEGMAASIQDTFVPMGFARGEAAKLSVQLTKLATDVASLNNEADAEVMRAFQSAIVGNHETVRRFGILITEANLKAELFRMGITKNIDAVSNQEKVQARLNLILQGSADSFNNAADTAGSFANRQRDLGRALDELQLVIGEKLLPAALRLTIVLTDLADAAAKVGQEEKTLTQRLIEQFPVLKNSLLPQLEILGAIHKSLPALLGETTVATDENTEAVKRNSDANDQAVKKSLLTELELSKLAQATKKLTIENEALNLVKQTGDELDGKILKAKRAISDANAVELEQIAEIMRANEALRVEIENQTVVMDTVQDATKRFGDSLSNNLADGLLNGKLALDDFKSIARDFVSQIISEFIRLAVINQILNMKVLLLLLKIKIITKIHVYN